MILREYQQEAIAAIYNHLRTQKDNCVTVIPTAGGKTPILATICKDAVERWDGRVLILSHVKELLEQSVKHIDATLDVGIYSAGLKSRDTDNAIIVAGIQSVYKRACELDAFDLIIVDEVHLVPEDGEGMYRTFLNEAKVVNPNVRVIGLTATPFRMKSGMICGPDNIMNHVCYEVGVRDLIAQGFLCPIRTKAGKVKPDTSGLHMSAGDFVKRETEELMNTDDLVGAACKEIVDQTHDRNSVLIFASGIAHGDHIAATLREKYGCNVATVYGDTLPVVRAMTLDAFKAGEIKYLVNVNVLTTGFDAPNIDCVAMVRPTASPGLYYQCFGRGFRIHPEKTECLCLDYGGNVIRHGPIDAIRITGKRTKREGEAPAKECPQCRSLIAAGFAVCPDCGFVFPEPEKGKHEAEAATDAIISGEVSLESFDVQSVRYGLWTKRGAKDGDPRTMRVDYEINWMTVKSEWVCFEHKGFARSKAESWWRRRSSAPIPEDSEEAARLASAGAVCATKSVVVRSVAGEKFDRIVGWDLGERPEDEDWYDDSDVPF